MREIVALLRDLVDSSGVQLKGLQQLLLAQHREGPRPPSYQVLSDRFRGRGLQNNASLIYAIIAVLAPPERKEGMTEEVRQHLVNARATLAAGRTQPSQEPNPIARIRNSWTCCERTATFVARWNGSSAAWRARRIASKHCATSWPPPSSGSVRRPGTG
ncbi:hypothetical protein [Streptomyces sp. CoH17]|uniref:hypothetical protein n=1 Tax=Streptomyces sp. CoH17 TaxID=2992806 RepID=UPI00226D62DA|nr:hypothetical protein [Streptomyces sp. CoH17]